MRARERASRLHPGLEGSTDVLPPSVSTAARFTPVVQVIERRELAKSEECVEVHVYPLPSDHAVAVAKIIYGEPLGYGHRWHISRLDIPALEAYSRATEQAEQRGIPFLWINDPHKLFPPSTRPILPEVVSGPSSLPEPDATPMPGTPARRGLRRG
jgi:hypothetical protein